MRPFTKEHVALLEVDVSDDRVRKNDQNFYNEAPEAIEKNDFDTVFACAKKYYALKMTENFLIEIVSDGQNRVLRRLEYDL